MLATDETRSRQSDERGRISANDHVLGGHGLHRAGRLTTAAAKAGFTVDVVSGPNPGRTDYVVPTDAGSAEESVGLCTRRRSWPA